VASTSEGTEIAVLLDEVNSHYKGIGKKALNIVSTKQAWERRGL